VDILYFDQDIVVCNKPPWLLSVPGRLPEHKDSLYTRVLSYFPTASVVHRLDCATSGVMVFALNKNSERYISIQFQNRQTEKTYQAIGAGISEKQEGVIDLPICVDWPRRPKQKIDFEQGKSSRTIYSVMESQANCTRFKLTPITGRSHQLRIHLRELGHPILGDRLYAPQDIIDASERLLLHAESLKFFHPSSAQKMSFYVECPF
jgi:tRNA pseudouridine32 synthase/23S rRNA pseudouridine746 synthase